MLRCARREAAQLACACATAAKAYHQCRWYTAVRVARSGAVLEPSSGTFAATVAPGEDVQAAVDACPRGGCVLLLPGTHAGPLVLTANQEVHLFGRGQATLRTSAGAGPVLSSMAERATVDGLIIVREGGGLSGENGVAITAGRLRLQASRMSSEAAAGIFVAGGDPFIIGCRYRDHDQIYSPERSRHI